VLCVYKYIHEHINKFMNANEFLRKKSVFRLDTRPSPRAWGVTNHWTTNHWTGLDWTGLES